MKKSQKMIVKDKTWSAKSREWEIVQLDRKYWKYWKTTINITNIEEY